MSTQPIPNYKPGVRVHGVNLGGWLVLERWMKESLFQGVNGKDETCFCVQLGREEASRRLHEHWDTWITEEDFAWIADHGFNAVRIPVGHWIFGPSSGYPYHKRFGADRHPYVDGGIERLDKAFDWAEKHGLLILIDLHCAPGCQNGFDNGGLEGVCDWWKDPKNVDFTVLTLERLAERYGQRKTLWGIETLNEPFPVKAFGGWWGKARLSFSLTVLCHLFYPQAYDAIRKHCSTDVAVVIHDAFLGADIRKWLRSINFEEPKYRNVVLDVHRYQCFTDDLKALDAAGNVRHAEEPLSEEICSFQNSICQTICGEWSLRAGGDRTNAERQQFFDAQVKAFENCQGCFFWSYKTEWNPNESDSHNISWSLRTAVEQGLKV